MKRAAVVLQKLRLEAGQRVLLAEQTPHAVTPVRIAAVKLHGFRLPELLYQRLINGEALIAVAAGRFEFMLAEALAQELRHPEMRVAQQGRNAEHGRQHLSIERTAAVTDKQVRALLFAERPDQRQGLPGMLREVGRQHGGSALESLTQGSGRRALTAGKETVQKQYLFHFIRRISLQMYKKISFFLPPSGFFYTFATRNTHQTL